MLTQGARSVEEENESDHPNAERYKERSHNKSVKPVVPLRLDDGRRRGWLGLLVACLGNVGWRCSLADNPASTDALADKRLTREADADDEER